MVKDVLEVAALRRSSVVACTSHEALEHRMILIVVSPEDVVVLVQLEDAVENACWHLRIEILVHEEAYYVLVVRRHVVLGDYEVVLERNGGSVALRNGEGQKFRGAFLFELLRLCGECREHVELRLDKLEYIRKVLRTFESGGD